MSDSNGVKRSKVRWGLIAFAIAIAVGIGAATILYGISKQIEYNREAKQHSAEYASHTDYPERYACFALPLNNQSNCIAKATDAARNYDRAEQDLVAQKTSALWAFLMGSGAIVGLMFSAVGIFLVWTTFRATKEGNEINRDIGQAQVRAYLSCKIARYRITEDRMFLDLEITNIGQSPASGIVVFGEVHLTVMGKQMINKINRAEAHVGSVPMSTEFQAIHAGTTNTEDVLFLWPNSFLLDEEYNPSLQEKKAFLRWDAITFTMTIEWTDVFKAKHQIKLWLAHERPRQSQRAKIKWPIIGGLAVYSSDPVYKQKDQ